MDIRSLCRVVVKFREAGAVTLAPVHEVLAFYPGATVSPLFISVSPETISRWVTKARQSDPGYRAPDFNTFYAISCPQQVNTNSLVQQLTGLHSVELAYIELGHPDLVEEEPAEGPGQPVGRPPGAAHRLTRPQQGYLHPAPEGINAFYAWQQPGGRGAIRVIDIEQGWQHHHEALTIRTLPCSGVNVHRFASHGAAVLGVLTLRPGHSGLAGMAPGADSYIISQWRSGGVFNTADAIMAAIGHLQFGDVLLLEAQTFYTGTNAKTWPIEIHEACFQAIRLAHALGIIVIEPAGNGSIDAAGGNDLDLLMVNGRPVFDPLSEGFPDSGAIMVGAACSTVPHSRLPRSNFGRRVNCYAWGEKVATAGSFPHPAAMIINNYTTAFGGTSAAAAIIAGAAILLQSITAARHHFRLSPLQMRSLLGADGYGTPSARGRFADKIGVMPNLQAIIDSF